MSVSFSSYSQNPRGSNSRTTILRGEGGRRLLFVSGYAAALRLAAADRAALMSTFAQHYAALNAEVEALRREVVQLRARAGLRDPRTPLQQPSSKKLSDKNAYS